MFRYKLRTLLILLAVGPPMLAWWAWPALLEMLKPRPDMMVVVFDSGETTPIMFVVNPAAVSDETPAPEP
jgi:hypothetical protein